MKRFLGHALELTIIVAAAILAAPQSGLSQGPPVESAAYAKRLSAARLPYAGSTSFDYSDAFATDNGFNPFRKENMFCPSDDPNCDVEDPLVFQAGGRVNSANYYGSMVGFASGISSEFHTDATLNTYLPADLSLAYITLGLTEPAVAAGLYHALNYVGNDVNNRLQSEQTFFSQMAVMPEVGQQLGQLHVNCIKKQQASGKNWMQAQAYCIGDTAELSEDKLKFEDLSGGIAQIKFSDDPNWWSEEVGGEERKILLSHYLFKTDANEDADSAFGKLMYDFQRYAGDIEYSLKEETEPDNQGQLELTFKKTDPAAIFEDEYVAYTKQYYDNIIKIQQDYCRWELDPSGTTRPPVDPGTLDLQRTTTKSGANKSPHVWYHGTGLGEKFTIYFSIPGYQANTMQFESLFGLVRASYPPSSGLEGSEICDLLDPEGTTEPLGWDYILKDPQNHGPMVRAYFHLSQRLGMGYVLSKLLVMDQFIRKVTIGPFDAVAKTAGLQLLREAANTSDLQKAYDENLLALRKYWENFSDYYHQIQGNQGRFLNIQREGNQAGQNSAINSN